MGGLTDYYATVAKIAFLGGPHEVGRGYRQTGIATLAEHGKDAVSSLCGANKQRFSKTR